MKKIFLAFLLLAFLGLANKSTASEREIKQIIEYGGSLLNEGWQCQEYGDSEINTQIKMIESNILRSFPKKDTQKIDIKSKLIEVFNKDKTDKNCSDFIKRYQNFLFHLGRLKKNSNNNSLNGKITIRKHERHGKHHFSQMKIFQFDDFFYLGEYLVRQEKAPFYIIIGFIVSLIFLRIFLAPSIKAFRKKSSIKYLVLLINLLFGLTIFGWIVAYILASIDGDEKNKNYHGSPWQPRGKNKKLDNPFEYNNMPQTNEKTCPRCGEENHIQARVCKSCNYKFD